MKIEIYETLKGFFKKHRNYRGKSIDYENTKILQKNDKTSILLDVRSPQEYKEGHLDGSINLPLYDISKKIDKIVPNKETSIIVYCQCGNRSKRAIEVLSEKGYENLYNILGGIENITI